MITTQVYHLALPLADDSERRWKPYRMFNGATPIIEELSCHASVLSPGFTPHPPHSHEEEELLIALQGEAELIIAKHRNGGLGDVPLSFQNEYPRFLSLQRAA